MDERSEHNLVGVHPHLIDLVKTTKFPHQVVITEGLRSEDRQRHLVENGNSWTFNSRHLTGHAVDFAIIENGKADWTFEKYEEIFKAINKKAKEKGIKIVWGGNWPGKKDGTHIQLDWQEYPLHVGQKVPANSKTVGVAVAAAPLVALIPAITEKIEEISQVLEKVSPNASAYLQLLSIVLIGGYIVWERYKTITREGV